MRSGMQLRVGAAKPDSNIKCRPIIKCTPQILRKRTEMVVCCLECTCILRWNDDRLDHKRFRNPFQNRSSLPFIQKVGQSHDVQGHELWSIKSRECPSIHPNLMWQLVTSGCENGKLTDWLRNDSNFHETLAPIPLSGPKSHTPPSSPRLCIPTQHHLCI